jgi:hypothetical protein
MRFVQWLKRLVAKWKARPREPDLTPEEYAEWQDKRAW